MANSFTPQQIEQFLQEFFDVVGARQYVGARYVPIFGRAGSDTVEWDDLAPYEPLTVVMHEGVSYVSRRYVPAGIQISDTAYWVQTYRFNAQVEQYRQEVLSFDGRISDVSTALSNEIEDRAAADNQVLRDVAEDYIPFPDGLQHSKYGSLGQVLSTLMNGSTEWVDPVHVTSDVAGPLVDEWLTDHPEATTTVIDGSITFAKLNQSLTDILIHRISLSEQSAEDDYSNLASNLPTFSIAYIGHTWFNDLPSGMSGAGWILTIGASSSNSFAAQFVFACEQPSCPVFYRAKKVSTAYYDWQEFDATKTYSNIAQLSSPTDLDDITSRGFYYVATNAAPSHTPSNNAYFMRVDYQGGVVSQTAFQFVGGFIMYNRYKIGEGSWSDWVTPLIPDGSITPQKINSGTYANLVKRISMNAEAALSYGNSLNNLPPNSIAWASPTWFNDTPSDIDDSYWIITIAAGAIAPVEIAFQIIININANKVLIRRKLYQESWGNWNRIDSIDSMNFLGSYADYTTGKDLDLITQRGIYYGASDTNPVHSPITWAQPAFVLEVGKSGSIVWQEFTQLTGNTYTKYRRLKIGANAWDTWDQIAEYPHRKNSRYFAFGDSTTKGQIPNGGGSDMTYAYPQIVADVLQMICVNQGVHGQGLCKDWTDINTTIDGLNMGSTNLITVGWAYNDAPTWTTMNRGDYTSTTDATVIGRYYLIMKKLQQKCPDAVVVLLTGYGDPSAVNGRATLSNQFTATYTFLDQTCTVREFYDELQKMAELHGWGCVNQAHGCVFNEWNATTVIGDSVHPTYVGQWMYGNYFAGQLSKYYMNIERRLM